MKPPMQIHHAMQAYLSGKATQDQGQALEAWLREDSANVRLLVDLALLDGLMLSMQKDDDAAAILSMLAEAEANAEPDFSLLHLPSFDAAPAKTAGRPMTFRKGWSLAGYALNLGLHTKAGVIGSIAAVLALGVLLVVVLLGDGTPGNPQQQITDNTPTKVGPVAPANPARQTIVATLTSANDAQWQAASGSRLPDIGEGLHAGQRLTLTQGFAEITTNYGAIAIIEAPASIELLDNDNALRLHSGKLVGICETESSKGFLVRTPLMDVTDLGTRFGVDTARGTIAEVHVFDGQVQVDRPATGAVAPQSKTLTQGQAVRAYADESKAKLVALSASPADFVSNVDTIWLGGTGRGHAAGEIDRDWRVIAADGQPVTEHSGMMVDPGMHDSDSNPATSQWLRINAALNPPGQKQVVFTCQSLFTVPNGFDPKAYELVIRCSADHAVKAVRINGHSLEVPKNRIGQGDKWVTWTLNEHFAPGQNTIEIDVLELFKNNGRVNSSSLRVELQAHRR